ncbi:MAG: fibronectin type III domain-containing protein [Kiritimatiellaeota bacterium]|nr:fibronectin type III domain-containing protein [Kiritimatiellota bacterium]
MAPTPLKWDGKDAQGNPLRWDTPGLRWDGVVPQPQGRHMQYMRVMIGFTTVKDHRLEEIAGAVIAGLTASTAAYPTPPVTPANLHTALTEFTAAVAAQEMGGKAATIDKNTKRDTLIGMLRQLAAYVQMKCNDDLQTLTSSGFEAVVNTHTQAPLAKPEIVNLDNGNSGQLLVRINAVAHAKSIEVRLAVVGAGNVPGPWQSAGLFTDSRALAINGLTPGTTYQVQVRAIGGSTGYSDWSDPSSHMSL